MALGREIARGTRNSRRPPRRKTAATISLCASSCAESATSFDCGRRASRTESHQLDQRRQPRCRRAAPPPRAVQHADPGHAPSWTTTAAAAPCSAPPSAAPGISCCGGATAPVGARARHGTTLTTTRLRDLHSRCPSPAAAPPSTRSARAGSTQRATFFAVGTYELIRRPTSCTTTRSSNKQSQLGGAGGDAADEEGRDARVRHGFNVVEEGCQDPSLTYGESERQSDRLPRPKVRAE